MNKLNIVKYDQMSKLHDVLGLTSDKLKEKKSRLFPVNAKGDITSNEVETTSIFLSVLSAVSGYGKELLSNIGVKQINYKNIQLHIFTELTLYDDKKEKVRPDGLIVLTDRSDDDPTILWASLIEAKIDKKLIDSEQIRKYIKYGESIGVNNIITISNQLVSRPDSSPTDIKFRKTKKKPFGLFHWSWVYLSITAGRLVENKTITDDDRIYILNEFKRYLDKHPKVKRYDDMGYKKIWKKATTQLLHNENMDEAIKNIAKLYKQEERNICLQLTDATNLYIKLEISDTPRLEELEGMLKKNNIINSTFFIDGDKLKTFTLDVNFKTGTVTIRTQHKIEKGLSKAQITALIKKLNDDVTEKNNIFIEAIYRKDKLHKNKRTLANLINEDGHYSIVKDIHKPIKRFEITMRDDLGDDLYDETKILNRLENLVKVFFKRVFIRLK